MHRTDVDAIALECRAGRRLRTASTILLSLARYVLAATFATGLGLLADGVDHVQAGDLGTVPLFDGERSDLLNLWGGPFGPGNTVGVSKQGSIVRSGVAAYRANLGSIPADGSRFFQTFSSAVNSTPGYRQDRDLTQYSSMAGYARNETGAPLTFTIEIKDYRDSTSHRARRIFTLPAGDDWTRIEAPLDLTDGWVVDGSPDLARTFALSFLVDADFGPASGSLYLDDFSLVEKGPPIDVATAPLEVLVERLARRQFHALWTARNKVSGIIPNSSDNVTLGALNTTTGVVWTLPAAVRRGWATQAEADAYMGQLVVALNANRDQTNYLPTRFLNMVTAGPVTDHEESTIDAAFIALALHNYKSQPATPQGLRAAIDALQNRFDFSAFVTPGAFRHAYFPATGLSSNTYSGFTNENKVIALAAELSDEHHVPLASMWNKDTGRTLAWLVDQEDSFLTYSFSTEYRAPFAQALINLFVDTSDRGVDNYAVRGLARNPWINFVRYEDEVGDKLVELGRENFFQPDAGQGPNATPPPAIAYKPWNLFNNFGRPDLFQPWSVALALLADAENADQALRFLLDNGLGGGLDGPHGLADWARWPTGAESPLSVPSFSDNWNMTLSTMALMEWLDGAERSSLAFANLPEVRAALDTVFLDGDLNGNGVTDAADLAIWRSGFGAPHAASPATGDADGDGDVDSADFLRWQRGLARGGPNGAWSGVPEPQGLNCLAPLLPVVLAAGRESRHGNPRRLVREKTLMKALASLPQKAYNRPERDMR